MNHSELVPLFNVRVYALIVKNNRLLISEEQHGGVFLRKFPGGGLQFGEGIVQALHRELKEELNADVESASMLCVTEDFVVSFLNNKQQVIGVHYLVDLKQDYSDEFLNNNRVELENGHIHFKWVLIDSLSSEDFTSTVDKSAFEKLKNFLLERG
jgi:ADP-ribose pyrophosphatase YjhB (NUDIX family)